MPDDQRRSMRETAYLSVLQASVTLTTLMRGRQGKEVQAALLQLEHTVEAARFYAPDPLAQALIALVSEARQWIRVAEVNSLESRAFKEAAATVDQRTSQIRLLMRDDTLPAQEPASVEADGAQQPQDPAVVYADDSTLLARTRIAFARGMPLSKRDAALTAGWIHILVASAVDFVLDILAATVLLKAAVWLIGTYWWTQFPTIGWLPAIGLIIVWKLWRLNQNSKEPLIVTRQSPPVPPANPAR